MKSQVVDYYENFICDTAEILDLDEEKKHELRTLCSWYAIDLSLQ